jgi:hypothetical protein
MSVVKSLLLAVGGAAMVATGVASTANAHVVAAGPGACEAYASEYAAVNAPRFGLFGWNAAYRHAYNECTTGGPSFVSADPYGYRTPFVTASTALAAPVQAGAHVAGSALYAGANIAGSALQAGASLAGTALSIPGAILGGTASAFAPAAPVTTPEPVAAPAPEMVKNYRGTYETQSVAAVEARVTSTTAALAVPADAAAPTPYTPQWYAYCEAKYRSFNPETGMYLAYSGTYRMCN